MAKLSNEDILGAIADMSVMVGLGFLILGNFNKKKA